MEKSQFFLYLCLSFIGGIFLGSIFFIPLVFILGFFIVAVLLISVFEDREKIAASGFCILLLTFGIFYFQSSYSKIENNDLKSFNNYDVVLKGVVLDEPDIRENNTKLTIKAEEIKFIDGNFQAVDGKVLVTINSYPRYSYGDELEIIGKTLVPENFEDFDYKSYLAKDKIYSVIYYPKVELIGKNKGNIILAGILSFKKKLRDSLFQSLPSPQNFILGAIILGDKKMLPDEVKNKLNIAGLRHITAVSGMHVAVLTSILMAFLIGLGLWRKHAFYLSVFLIFLFVVITGFQASAIRAGIMGGILLLAQHLGRQKNILNVLVFAGVIMLLVNPLLLKIDIGFQLSFLAVLGIIYFFPFFYKWVKRIFRKVPDFLGFKSILAITISAQLFTLPILIYNFGYISLASLVSNILVIPLLPFIMGLGFVSALLGMVFYPLGIALSWPVWLLLSWVVKVIDLFSAFPVVELNIHWIFLVLFYLPLGYFAQKLKKDQELGFLYF